MTTKAKHPRVEREKRALSSMRTWGRNYREGDVGAIFTSIQRWGFNGALRVWYDRDKPNEPPTVIAGNHTYLALLQMRDEGCDPPEHIDVDDEGDWRVAWIDVSHLSLAEAEAFAIADNRTTELATFDEEKLAGLLREIAERDPDDLIATGFDEDDLDNLLRRLGQIDEGRPPAPEARLDRLKELLDEWGTALGQIWEVPSESVAGRSHRILCGDSTDPAQVARLMAGERAVLFSTDPPYLVGYDGTNHPTKWNASPKEREVTNKDWSEVYNDRWDDPSQGEDLYDGFVAAALAEAITEDAAWYCWHASRNQAMVEQVWERHGAFVHQQIIWVKDRPLLTRSWYMWQHEPCFFGWVRGKKPKKVSDQYPRSVWQFTSGRGETTEDHPTAKAVELFEIPMVEHTSRGDLCYEPFIGSGTQHVAAERLGRVCYGVEIQPAFVAVTLERLREMGLKPRLVEEVGAGE